MSDEEWAFVAPYLALLPEDAGQRRYALREVFNALRYLVWTGAPWRALPHDLPPWIVVYQQARRWLAAGSFEALVADLRLLLRLAAGRRGQPTAAILDSRTLQSTPGERGAGRLRRAQAAQGLQGARGGRHPGAPAGAAVTPANAQDRAQVDDAGAPGPGGDRRDVELAYVDQGYTGEQPAADAAAQGIRLEVVKLPEAKRGFVLLPRRWVVERSFRLDGALPPPGPRLRAPARAAGGPALRGLRLPDAASAHPSPLESLTRSSV